MSEEDSKGLQRKLVRIEMSTFQGSGPETKFRVREIKRDTRGGITLGRTTFSFLVDRTKLHPEDRRHLIAGLEIVTEYKMVGANRNLKALYPPCHNPEDREDPFYVFD